MFVPYVRYEVRFWFIAVLMAMLNLAKSTGPEGSVEEDVGAKRAWAGNTHGQR
jgi:hypothetical protein